MKLTQSVLDLNLQHQKIKDICTLKNNELLETLHSLEHGIGRRHGKGCKILKLYIRGPEWQSVCLSCGVSGS